MNGLNGKPTEYPENALVPYPVILAASKGDPDAMKIVLQHFSGYIASLSMRKLYDERGNVYFGVDEEIRERLQAKLMRQSSHLGLNKPTRYWNASPFSVPYRRTALCSLTKKAAQ